MVPPKGRIAALLLPALLALLPAAAQAQQRNCPHQNGVPQTGQFQGQSMNSTPPQMSQTSFMSQMSQMCGMRNQTSQMNSTPPQTSFMSQMSQMCGMRNQTSQTSTTQQMQLVAMQQLQWVAMQQMQLVALQQQMQAMQQLEMVAARQQPVPFQQLQQGPSPPPLGLVQKKQTSGLLKEMTALQQRLDGLQEAAQRNELQPTEASAVQQEVNALQQEVDALPKPPHAVLERMSALRRQTDEVLQQATARPADLLAAVRSGR